MKERPILFNTEMVRAIQSGIKTQTRRIVKPFQIPTQLQDGSWHAIAQIHPRWGYGVTGKTEQECAKELSGSAPCPHGNRGDHLWVRECYSGPHWMTGVPPRDWIPGTPLWFWADGRIPTHGDWTKPKPGIHMPRWASRIMLEITGVKVERLQDISEEDARAEGVSATGWQPSYSNPDNSNCDESNSAADAFFELWESINPVEIPLLDEDGKKIGMQQNPASWDANPWVWVIEFKRVQP